MSLFLTDEELRELTGRKRYASQMKWLKQWHIAFAIRADGKPIVLRSALEERLGGPKGERRRQTEPDWTYLDQENAQQEARRKKKPT